MSEEKTYKIRTDSTIYEIKLSKEDDLYKADCDYDKRLQADPEHLHIPRSRWFHIEFEGSTEDEVNEKIKNWIKENDSDNIELIRN